MNNSEQLVENIKKFISLLKSEKESLEKEREKCIKKFEELTQTAKNSVQFLSDYLLNKIDLKDFETIKDSVELLEDLIRTVKNKIKTEITAKETVKIADCSFSIIKNKEKTYFSSDLGLLIKEEDNGYKLFDLQLQRLIIKDIKSLEELGIKVNKYIDLYGEIRKDN